MSQHAHTMDIHSINIALQTQPGVHLISDHGEVVALQVTHVDGGVLFKRQPVGASITLAELVRLFGMEHAATYELPVPQICASVPPLLGEASGTTQPLLLADSARASEGEGERAGSDGDTTASAVDDGAPPVGSAPDDATASTSAASTEDGEEKKKVPCRVCTFPVLPGRGESIHIRKAHHLDPKTMKPLVQADTQLTAQTDAAVAPEPTNHAHAGEEDPVADVALEAGVAFPVGAAVVGEALGVDVPVDDTGGDAALNPFSPQ